MRYKPVSEKLGSSGGVGVGVGNRSDKGPTIFRGLRIRRLQLSARDVKSSAKVELITAVLFEMSETLRLVSPLTVKCRLLPASNFN